MNFLCNIRSRERLVQGTNGPGNESSRELGPTNCRYYLRHGVKLNTTLTTNTDPNPYSNPNPDPNPNQPAQWAGLDPNAWIQRLVKVYSCRMNLGR